MANRFPKRFPFYAKNYELFEEVGEGVSATVYKARCIPLNEIVAVKVLDLERCRNDLDIIRKEVQTMSLIDHPNLLKAHCSFIDGSNLWIVMPYMSSGSCFHIMKSTYPEGFEQSVIATLLREALKALDYLHAHGHIHRDVKAGNILIDAKGTVKLGDFGVSACMFDSGERKLTRNTFVGTPCWMAPEVMQPKDGYDFRADIWSFGITALELAHGHAPFSKYPPMKVLLMTLQNAPPRLDYDRDKFFSKSFKELVAACLMKDPKKRPTSAKLLKHPFFKHARSMSYLARKILDGLSPLGERFRWLKEKEVELLLQNKDADNYKEQLSEQEYMRGISAWNFDLDDLRKQAGLIQDDEFSNTENQDFGFDQNFQFDNVAIPQNSPSIDRPKGIPVERSKSLPVERRTKSNQCYRKGDVMDTPSGSASPLLGQSPVAVTGTPASILQLFQRLLQQNDMQREKVTKIVKYINRTMGNVYFSTTLLLFFLFLYVGNESLLVYMVYVGEWTAYTNSVTNIDSLQISSTLRERDLQSQVNLLEESVGKFVEELQGQKTANAQLERQIDAVMRSKIL